MLSSLWADEAAQGLVEYALVISLVSLCAVAALMLLGMKTSGTAKRAARFLQ